MKTNSVMMLSGILCYAFLLSRVTGEQVVARFEGYGLTTLTKDSTTGLLFVGSQNYIHKLRANLTDIAVTKTGPRNDSLNCPPNPSKKCGEPRIPQNNTNTLLVIDNQNQIVIACSTLYYGFCEKYSMEALELVQNVYEQIVTNAEIPVVGMIADGFEGKLLYVGSPPSVLGRYSDVGAKPLPMLASRNVNSLEIAFRNISSASFKDYHSEYRKNGYVEFKKVFEYGVYVYYLTVQKERSGGNFGGSGAASYKSYLVRICKNDKKYQSYIQIPLTCDVWPDSYNIAQAGYVTYPGKKLAELDGFDEKKKALFISFSKSFSQSSTISHDSAICVYPLDEIVRTFSQTLVNCFNGNGFLGPEFLKKHRGSCQRRTTNIGESYCGEYDVNHPIEGQDAAQPKLVTKISALIVNSLVVKTTGDATIALMGTSTGNLLKMIIETPETSKVYHTMLLAKDQAIRQDMEFDNKKDHLYAMTSTQVMKIKLSYCDVHTDCDSCLNANDPHCGWCFTYNKCMTDRECPKDAQYENYKPWLSYKSTCPTITSLQPNPIGYDSIQETELQVKMNILPNVAPGSLFCELHAHIFRTSTSASWVPESDGVVITCQPFERLQTLPNHESNLTAQLSIKLDQAIYWASSPLEVYDCSARGVSCHNCTSTEYPCTWCVSDHKCVSSNQGCSDNNYIYSIKPEGAAILPEDSQIGKEYCPRIELPEGQELISHAGVNQMFQVKTYNLKDSISNLQCKFMLQGVPLKVAATLAKDIIECDLVALGYSQNIPFEMARFDVTWGPSEFVIDNPNDVTVKVYKCTQMEDHCGKCLVMPPQYGCGWCAPGLPKTDILASCSLQTDCQTVWLDYTKDCPNVQVEGIEPTSGPIKGGTNITITGKNMGKVIGDLVKVDVAGVPCQIIDYEPSTRFVCTSGPAEEKSSGQVFVDVKDKYSGTSDLQYTYVDPTIEGFFPKMGPKAGGTNVTITGEDFDAGNQVSVTMEGIPCVVRGRNATALWITTTEQQHPIKTNIVIKVDNSQDIISKEQFHFGENPIINAVRPDRAIVSGGNTLDVEGVDLNSVQNPKFFVRADDKILMTECLPTSEAAFMHCIAPDVSHLSPELTLPAMLHYGFVMDGVTDLLYISEADGFQPLTYYPDPEVYPFKTVKQYERENELTIIGRNLMELHVFKDIAITVGGSLCTKEQVISDSLITCDPPSPDMTSVNKDGNAEVQFTLGNFKQSLGYLKYRNNAGLPLGAVIGIALAAAMLVALAIILFMIMRRRKNKKKQEKPPSNFIYKPRASRPNQYQDGGDGAEIAEAVPLRSDTDCTPSANNPGEIQDEETYLSMVLSRIENETLRKKVQEVLISRKRVELKEELGKGHFGQVFLANLLEENLDSPREVAVKTLQGSDLDQKQIENFLREGVIMKRFRHLHIMSLLGVCIGPNQEPMVILPYMANGDLRNYVKDKKKNFTARQLLHLAQQVAEGMAYLASLNFVHRDLAARNCMIDDTSTVKVADFGLTREIYEREYYSLKDRKAKLPIKWMALESLEDYVFTMKSDVWSFGVLMWELMTRGVTPYPDVDAFDLRNYLASGRRLRKPKYCPDNVYKIMLDCWDEIPERRPNFADLVNRLEILLNPPKKRTSSREDTEPIYQNLSKADTDYLNPVTSEDTEA